MNAGVESTRVLSAAVSPGATTLNVTETMAKVPSFAAGSSIVLDPKSVDAELHRVKSVSGKVLTLFRPLTYAHPAATRLFAITPGLIPWTWFGGKGDGNTADATTNSTAFNRLGQQLLAVGSGAGIFVPAGTWYVDSPLILQHGQTVAGSSPDLSLIKAHTTFPFTDTGDVAVMIGVRGSIVANYNAAPLSRYYLRDFYVSGEELPNSNGILVGLQQPTHWENVRVDHCAGKYGICPSGQDAKFSNIELSGNNVGLRLRGGTFFFFVGLNVERSTTSHIVIEDKNVTDYPSFYDTFRNVHIEGVCSAPAIDVSGGASGLSFYDVWYSNGPVGTLFKFDTPYANPGGSCRYLLTNVRCNQNDNGFLMVDDVQRSFSLNSWSDTDRMIMFLVAHDDSPPTYYAG